MRTERRNVKAFVLFTFLWFIFHVIAGAMQRLGSKENEIGLGREEGGALQADQYICVQAFETLTHPRLSRGLLVVRRMYNYHRYI